MEMEGDTAVDSIKRKTMSIKIKAQSLEIWGNINIGGSSGPSSTRCLYKLLYSAGSQALWVQSTLDLGSL